MSEFDNNNRVSMTIRFSQRVHDDLQKAAKIGNVSINYIVDRSAGETAKQLIQEYVDKQSESEEKDIKG